MKQGRSSARCSRRKWFSRFGLAPVLAIQCGRKSLAESPPRPFRRSRRRVAPAPFLPDTSFWGDEGLYAAWLGHSTVLLKIDGRMVLTDPIFSRRAGVHLRFCTLGLRRRVAPALAIANLPRPDVIVLSHAHMDHFDIPSLRKLAHPETRLITACGTSDLVPLRRRFRAVQEAGWEDGVRIGSVGVTAFEVNHWGARYGSDTWRGYNGYVIESGRYRVLFAGDTALTDRFRTLKSPRPFDLAIMPIGAYNPRIHHHCSPEQAWRMANEAGAERILPVHHQTFPLGQEPAFEPIERFHDAAGSQVDRIAASRIGEQVRII